MKSLKQHMILCLLAALLSQPLFSHVSEREPEVAIARGASARWVEPGVLALSFTCPRSIDMGGETMIRICPSVKREGRRPVYFPPVVYLNRAGFRYFERRQQYQPDASLAQARVLVTEAGASGTLYTYRDTLAVGAVAEGALVLDYYYTDCCHDHLLLTDTVPVPRGFPGVRQLLPLPVLVNRIALDGTTVVFRSPTGESLKQRRERVCLPLRFRVNRWAVEEDYLDNSVCLERLDSVLSPVFLNREDYLLERLHVSGYASPEGPENHNRMLSERRAESFASWLCSHYGLAPEGVSRSGRGEDWDGLREQVDRDSLLEERAEIIALIDRFAASHERKRRLVSLNGGHAYRYLLSHIYPVLRRMELEVSYTVRRFSAEEASKLLSTRPQDLDARELYEAARLQGGTASVAANGAFDIAARLHPDDVPTLVNAASAALLRYDLETAGCYLEALAEEPLAWNNLGVYCWMCGDTDRAREYFLRASGVTPEAEVNLSRLKRWEEDGQ